MVTTAVIAASLAAQVQAAAQKYCVVSIGIDRRTASAPFNQSHGPTRFLLAGEAATPVAIDDVRVPPAAPTYKVRTAFWRYRPDFRFEGPYWLDYSTQNPVTDGVRTYLQGYRELKDTALARKIGRPISDGRVFFAESGGVPKALGGPLALKDWQFLLRTYNPRLTGVVVEGITGGFDTPQKHSTFLVQGSNARFVNDKSVGGIERMFPRWRLSVATRDRQVSLFDPASGRRTDLTLPHANDLPMWESVNVDRDGWIFAEGEGYDYAIKWHHAGSAIQTDRIIRYSGEGWFERFLKWILGVHRGETPIDETVSSAQCVDFSRVLQLTLFCKPAKVFREGRLKPIGDGETPLKRWIGDSTSLGVALFSGSDGGLYAFDRNSVRRVNGIGGDLTHIVDLPASRRTFAYAYGGTFEIVGRFPNLRGRRLNLPGDPARSVSGRYPTLEVQVTEFQLTHDAIAFSPMGIWRLGDQAAETIWRSDKTPIQLAGGISPTSVAVWGGTIFRTADEKLHLLKLCRSS